MIAKKKLLEKYLGRPKTIKKYFIKKKKSHYAKDYHVSISNKKNSNKSLKEAKRAW